LHLLHLYIFIIPIIIHLLGKIVKQGMSYPMIFHAILERLAEMVIQCQHEEWLGISSNED